MNTDTHLIDDLELGRFTWDQQHRFWMGQIEPLVGGPAYLTIHVGLDEQEKALFLARETVARVPAVEPEARRFAAVSLLNAQRPEWANTKPPDVEHAVTQMVLNSVLIRANGMLELAYSNDDDFGAIEFVVWFDRNGNGGVTILGDELTEHDSS